MEYFIMRLFTRILATFSAILLAGCMTLPPLPSTRAVNVQDIVTALRCQLIDVVNNTPSLRNYSVGFDLDLEVIREGGGTGDATFVVPISMGTFTIGFTAGATEQTTRLIGLDFEGIKLGPLADAPSSLCDNHTIKGPTRYNLTGDFGLQEVVDRMGNDILNDSTVKTFSQSAKFVVTLEGSVNPSVKLVPSATRSKSYGIKLSGKHKKTHTLLITFTPEKIKTVSLRRPTKRRGRTVVPPRFTAPSKTFNLVPASPPAQDRINKGNDKARSTLDDRNDN